MTFEKGSCSHTSDESRFVGLMQAEFNFNNLKLIFICNKCKFRVEKNYKFSTLFNEIDKEINAQSIKIRRASNSDVNLNLVKLLRTINSLKLHRHIDSIIELYSVIHYTSNRRTKIANAIDNYVKINGINDVIVIEELFDIIKTEFNTIRQAFETLYSTMLKISPIIMFELLNEHSEKIDEYIKLFNLFESEYLNVYSNYLPVQEKLDLLDDFIILEDITINCI